MAKHSDITYDSIRAQCMRSGMSLREACLKAGVPYQTVAGWKRSLPKSFEYLNKIQGALVTDNDQTV